MAPLAPLAAIHNKSLLYVNCHVCCTATIVRSLVQLVSLVTNTRKKILCRNSEEVETVGDVSDW